jgi:type I restriction enzyme M protein
MTATQTAEPNISTNGISENRRQEVQQAVKNASDQMRIEGVPPRDYVEQLSWLFFLKAFEETENRREEEESFSDTPYTRRLDGEYRWSAWAKRTDRPDEMLLFVNGKLFPYLQNMGEDSLATRFGRIFSTIKNHQSRGASFARVVAQIDKLHFSDKTDVIVLSEIYERLLEDVAKVSGYAGEFYTPRHIIRAMVNVVAPRAGDKVYDPCFGSAGFLSEAASVIRGSKRSWSNEALERFHKETFFGREMGALAYLMGTMNLILHDVHEPSLELVNTLETHSNIVPEDKKYSVILANPPYGGKLAQQLQTNFTVRSGSTEVLFLQHIMKTLARRGRAGVVVPEGVLFRGGPDQKVRQKLLEEFNVHTVLSLPGGVFLPYTGVKTNIIFFNREEDERKTESVWFYELTNDGFELKQTRRPIEGEQFTDFGMKWKERAISENSWVVPMSEIEKKGFDLSVKNPNRKGDYEHRPALDLVQSIKAKEERVFALLGELEEMLESN